VFGRFGGLIDIYLLAGKTCGYAKYANRESAEKAVATLHGQEICGNRYPFLFRCLDSVWLDLEVGIISYVVHG
jgi:hypothetical protein